MAFVRSRWRSNDPDPRHRPLAAACSRWGATCRATTCEAIAPVTILPVDGTCPGWGLDGEIRTASTLEELMGIIDGGAILYGNHGFVSAAFQNYLGVIAGQPVAASVNLFNQGTEAQAGELFDDPQSGSGTAVTDWTGSGEARTLVGFGTTSFQFHEECFYVSILVVSAEGEALPPPAAWPTESVSSFAGPFPPVSGVGDRSRRGSDSEPLVPHVFAREEAAATMSGDERGIRQNVHGNPSSGGILPLSRRRFIKSAMVGAAGLMAGPRLLLPNWARADVRSSRVVRTYHYNATTGWSTVNQGPVDMMVHAAVRALTGIGVTAWAWKSLFPGITAAHKVGIKINLSCGDVPTHPQVVNAIIDGLLMMDLDGLQLPKNITVWDMDNPFFCPQTGYAVNYGGPGVQYYEPITPVSATT